MLRGCHLQLPAWPFILLSFVFTFYALAPYFAGDVCF